MKRGLKLNYLAFKISRRNIGLKIGPDEKERVAVRPDKLLV